MEGSLETITKMMQSREWSWTLVGVAYLIVTLIVRHWFISPFISRAKDLKRTYYQEIKELYVKRAFQGWVFYFIGFISTLVLWYQGRLYPIAKNEIIFFLLIIALNLITILLHVKALSIAAVVVLKRTETE